MILKNKPWLAMIVLSLLVSCGSSKKAGDNSMDNSLSKRDRSQGYQLLFDGKTMDGWRTFQNKSSASWDVENGSLHCKGGKGNYGAITADLMTNSEYENFDLSLDWKISPGGNSGILYMVTEKYPYSFETGPEYQIIDDKGFPEKLEDWQLTAANYAMNPAPTAEPKPAGEWNHTRIIVNNNHVEHWLNGKKVVEYELYSDDWYHRKNTGKWKDVPSYGESKTGHITFQNHGSEAWFKNIKLKQL